MSSPISRKMGALEKLSAILHDAAGGSIAASVLLKINEHPDFELFKHAQHILFAPHPLLRVLNVLKAPKL